MLFFPHPAHAPVSESEVYMHNDTRKVIVINPGHGGLNTGYTRGDIVEKCLTPEISKRIKSKIDSTKYKVVLTRYDDTPLNTDSLDLNLDCTVDLKDEPYAIENFAKNLNADYFLDIHLNANWSKRVSGMELYTYGIKNVKKIANGRKDFRTFADINICYEESTNFAMDFHDYLSASGIESKIIGMDARILYLNPAPKTLLLEYFYLTNKKERELLLSDKGFDSLASLTANYFNNLDSE